MLRQDASTAEMEDDSMSETSDNDEESETGTQPEPAVLVWWRLLRRDCCFHIRHSVQVFLDVLRVQYYAPVPEYTIIHASTMPNRTVADILTFVDLHYRTLLEPRVCLIGVKRRGENELALGPAASIDKVSCTSVSKTMHWGFYKSLEIVAIDLSVFVAFVLGTHARCGDQSQVQELNADTMQIIFAMLKQSHLQAVA